MNAFMQQALLAANGDDTGQNWLSAVHERGRACWQTHTFPGRKVEAWKYTNLRFLEQGDYQHSAPAPAGVVEQSLDIPGLDAIRLVFLNGQFQPQLSISADSLPDGVELVNFASASPEQQVTINSLLDTVSLPEKHLFAAHNSAGTAEGVFLHLQSGVQLTTPVHVVYSNGRGEQGYQVLQRLLVVLESGSEATLIEHYSAGDEDRNDFTNSVSELVLRDNARLHHYRLHLEHESTIHIGGVHAELGRSATLNSFHLGLGSRIKRLDLVVNHRGEGAHCELNGVYLPRREQQVDYHTCIEHAVPHCTTNEVFRGIIADSAKAVFNGRIHIHPQAQKTLAQLSNKNLLTSNKAEVDTKPELEIYADDVQCAHGATVAQLDNTALHYLRTRGVSEAEARVMMSFGFINELLNDIRLQPVAEYLRPQLAESFARDRDLMRHLG